MRTRLADQALLVEVGWEVCSQLGGIYTVLRTKAQTMVSEWGDRYCLLGPYNASSAAVEFEPALRTGPFAVACDRIEREKGIKAHFGYWLIDGRPQVVLLELDPSRAQLATCKYLMWKDHDIQVGDDREVDDCVLFGYLAADFLQALSAVLKEASQPRASGVPPSAPSEDDGDIEWIAPGPALAEPPRILAHFHEWMAGVPIPILLKRKVALDTVFTTHATILGRYLAAGDTGFYENLSRVNPWEEARRRNILNRYSIERAATWGATCFTTISEITAIEAEILLGRRPDVLLPNGLNIRRLAAVHEFQNLHLRYKKRIQEFIMAHFFPSYTFDLGKTLHLFTSGRYEHRNKGFDLFIEALARLNHRLKAAKLDLTVVAFIVTRAPNRGFNSGVLKNQMIFNEMRHQCENIASGVSSKLLGAMSMGQNPREAMQIEDQEFHSLRRVTHAWRQTSPFPSVVTHDLEDEWRDAVLSQLRNSRLLNHREDPVKVVYHPEFLSTANPILNLDYEQFVRGCHLGVFPSYYEPWGYTPEECAALGIPSVTSDLAGFGGFVRRNIPKHEEKGLFVIDRRSRNFHQSADQLAEALFRFVSLTMRERIEMRNRVEAESSRFDWKELVPAYHRAHEIALERGHASNGNGNGTGTGNGHRAKRR